MIQQTLLFIVKVNGALLNAADAKLLDTVWLRAELLGQLTGARPTLTVAVYIVDEDGLRICNLLLLASVAVLEDLVSVDLHAFLAAFALHMVF